MPSKNHFWFPKEPFSKQFLKEHFEEHLKKLKNLFCVWKIPWMLKVLQKTIDANKEPLFIRVHLKLFNQLKMISENPFRTFNSQTSYLLPAPCPWASPRPLRSGPRLVAARECPPPRWPMSPLPPLHVRSSERAVCSPYGNPRSQTSGRRSRQRWRDDWDPRAASGSPQVNRTLLAWSGKTGFLGWNQEGTACRGRR